jgi:hypothetical protein
VIFDPEHFCDRPDFTSDAIYLLPLSIAVLRSSRQMERLTFVLAALTAILACCSLSSRLKPFAPQLLAMGNPDAYRRAGFYDDILQTCQSQYGHYPVGVLERSRKLRQLLFLAAKTAGHRSSLSSKSSANVSFAAERWSETPQASRRFSSI